MRNKKVIALIALGIGAFISLVYGITAPPKGKARSVRPQPRGSASSKQPVSRAAQIVPTERHAQTTQFDSWGKNPFAKEEVKAEAAFALNGIIWEEANPVAIINDTIVSAGDKIGAFTVVAINQDRVILNDGSTNIELKLTPED